MPPRPSQLAFALSTPLILLPHPKTISPRPQTPLARFSNRSSTHSSPTPSLPHPHSSPPGTLRPKQSLGQNFLRDTTVIASIIDAFAMAHASSCPAARVLEVGPGTGALTAPLLARYPAMRALELDQRAVALLHDAHPALDVARADVLDVDWAAEAPGAGLAVIGNLPYNIVSQIMFGLMEAPAGAVRLAVVMMQKEVADRVTARTRTKAYGILSVICQLYTKPTVLFGVPPESFSPRPSVNSAMVRLDFEVDETLDVFNTTLTAGLRQVVRFAFQQRRKVMRNSLRLLCEEKGVELPEKWSRSRPEEIPPREFVEITKFIYAEELRNPVLVDRSVPGARPDTVWRPAPGEKLKL